MNHTTKLIMGTALTVVTAGCTGSNTSSTAQRTGEATKSPAAPSCIKSQDGTDCLPLAPDSRRVDLAPPKFANPTSITNPLNPLSRLTQVIYGGQVDGKPFRTEFTRLPGTRTVSWNGRQIKTIVMQYLAFSDGRIEEVALDQFGQADDGAVWYFGEDVFNYKDGVVADHEGTWHAGKDGPAAMIMPASPKVGVAYRSENIPGLVFEEVTVKSVDQTVSGPSGSVTGAMVAGELHMDGAREDKIFAPGYGEFSTGSPNGDLEQVTLAVPTDARPGPPPTLAALSAAVMKTYDAVGKNDWAAAGAEFNAMRKMWDAYRSDVPDLLGKQMSRDIDQLTRAIAAREPAAAHRAVLRVAQNNLDLQVRHQPVGKVDLARLSLWARQLAVDSRAEDLGAVAGDVASLEWTRDRIRHVIGKPDAVRLDDQLRDLRTAVGKKDHAAVAKIAPVLLATTTAL